MSAELEIRTLADVPALIERERHELAELHRPEDVREAEKRAAAIAELTRRAGLAIPVQNQATLYRAEALERLAVVVGEAQENGEVGVPHRRAKGSDARTLSDLRLDKRRLAEGRALAETDVLARARDQAEKRPDRPIRFNDLIVRAERVRRLNAGVEKRQRLEHEARAERARKEARGLRPFRLEVGDIRSWWPGQQVDAIVTDPPYVTDDALELYRELAGFTFDALRPGGALAVMVWPPMLVDVAEALKSPGLVYRWSIVWRFTTHKSTPDHKRRVFDQTKLVLVYHRAAMPDDAPYLVDFVEAANSEKDLHPWQQSLEGFEWLVERLTWPGDTICDPFAGSGTTAVAALRKERQFIGCDKDPEAVALALKRLA